MSSIYQERFDVDPANQQISVGGRIYFHPCLPALQQFGVLLLGASQIRHAYRVERRGAPFHVLVCCESGSGWVLHEGQRLRLGPGQLAWLPAGSQSGLERDSENWCFSWFLLEPGPSWHLASELLIRDCDDSTALFMAASLLALEARRPARVLPQTQPALALLIGLLQRALCIAPSHPVCSRLNELFSIVEAEPARDWRVDELAAHFGVSASHFQRLCQTHLGHGPRDEIVARRMRCARDWLLQGRGNVSDIATLVGYAEVASFSRRFTRHFGESPGTIVSYLQQSALP